MLLDDAAWLFNSYLRRFRYPITDIRAHVPVQEGDIRLRARRAGLAMLLLFPLPFGFVALDFVAGGPSFGPSYGFIASLWVLSAVGYFLLSFLGPRIRRAVVAFGVASVVPLPVALALLAAGFQAYAFHTFQPVLPFARALAAAIALALVVGFGRSLERFRLALKKWRTPSRLEDDDGNFNPAFTASNPAGPRVGCILILLSVIATPLGLNLRSIIGHDSASIVVSLILIFLGAGIAYVSCLQFAMYAVALLQIERQDNVTLRLPPYDPVRADQAA